LLSVALPLAAAIPLFLIDEDPSSFSFHGHLVGSSASAGDHRPFSGCVPLHPLRVDQSLSGRVVDALFDFLGPFAMGRRLSALWPYSPSIWQEVVFSFQSQWLGVNASSKSQL